jgi:branched-chain amino acid transport system ATP-binding protein
VALSGDIFLNGRKIDGMKPYEVNRLGLALSFQVSKLFTRLSVVENVRCAVQRHARWRSASPSAAVPA